jgi:hypothetical protein
MTLRLLAWLCVFAAPAFAAQDKPKQVPTGFCDVDASGELTAKFTAPGAYRRHPGGWLVMITSINPADRNATVQLGIPESTKKGKHRLKERNVKDGKIVAVGATLTYVDAADRMTFHDAISGQLKLLAVPSTFTIDFATGQSKAIVVCKGLLEYK